MSATPQTELTVSYTIADRPALPVDAPRPPSDPSDTLRFPLVADGHLSALALALGQARDQLNERLTEWKTAYAKVEIVPKDKKRKEEDEDELEDGGEGADEE